MGVVDSEWSTICHTFLHSLVDECLGSTLQERGTEDHQDFYAALGTRVNVFEVFPTLVTKE